MENVPINGDVRRHGPVQPSIFGPKLVHLLFSCRSHWNSTAGGEKGVNKILATNL